MSIQDGATQVIPFPLFHFQPYCIEAFWLQLKKIAKNLHKLLRTFNYIIEYSCLVSIEVHVGTMFSFFPLFLYLSGELDTWLSMSLQMA